MDFLSVERLSFKAGMMNAFCEAIYREAKPMAFSSAMEPDAFNLLIPVAEEILRRYPVKYFLEKELVDTDFSRKEDMQGKWVLIFYKFESDLEAYMELKAWVENKKAEGAYTPEDRKEATRRLCRLLGYSEGHINELIK